MLPRRFLSLLKPRSSTRPRSRPRMRLALESLETRLNPSASFLVTTTSDSGAGSLRAAITSANAQSDHGEIYFAPELAHKVFHLQTHAPSSNDSPIYGASAFQVTGSVIIHGTGQILDALGVHRHFFVAISGELTLANLELTDGMAQGGDGGVGWNGGGGAGAMGGSILNLGVLQVSNCEFDQNGARGGTGGDNPAGINGGGGGGGMNASGLDGSGNGGGAGGGPNGGIGGGSTGASSGLTGGGGGGGDSTHNGSSAGFGGGGGGAGRNSTGLGGVAPSVAVVAAATCALPVA